MFYLLSRLYSLLKNKLPEKFVDQVDEFIQEIKDLFAEDKESKSEDGEITETVSKFNFQNKN